MGQIIVFSFIYMILDDSHFSGINTLEEMIRDELLQRKIDPIIKENFEDKLEKEIKEIKKEIKKDERETVKKLTKPTVFASFFKRLYFSFVTGTTLGYGDIFPNTVFCKTLTIIQLITSILILVF